MASKKDMGYLVEHVEVRDEITLLNGGQKMFGVIHRPVGVKRAPAVLMCHGFAGTKVGRFRIYVRLAEALARRGIASMRIDFRGCGDSEGAFQHTTLSGQVEDAMLALKWLGEDEDIDISRLGVMGRSLGAPVALLTSGRFGGIKSLAIWAAVFNGAPWASAWQHAKSAKNGDLPPGTVIFQGQLANQQLFAEFMALDMRKELKLLDHVPMLQIHSESDELVPLSQAEEYRACRKEAKALSEFIRLTASDHDCSDYHEQETSIAKTAEWFEKTL